MVAKNSLTVICPVYNEAQSIEEFYIRLWNELSVSCKETENYVLFVLDKSSDETEQILEKICEKDHRTRLIVMASRYGHQNALVAGIDHADTDIVIMMDSDLQHPPSLIPKMIAEFASGSEVVAAIRVEDKAKGALLKFASRKFYSIWNHFSGLKLAPGEADFRLISKRVADVFRKNIREKNPFLRGLFFWIGFKRSTIEYTAEPRFAGDSKYTITRLISFATNSVLSFSTVPLNYAIYFGLLGATMSLIGLALVVFDFILHGAAPSGWYTLTTLILFFSGVQLLFIGLIGRYVGMIFEEVKNRPTYIIDRKLNFDSLRNLSSN